LTRRKDLFRFFFTSHDREEEPHIHAEGSGGIMKIFLKDLSVEYSRGLTYSKERKILAIVEENQKFFTKEWKKFFKEK
jgi:hypothetical protein